MKELKFSKTKLNLWTLRPNGKYKLVKIPMKYKTKYLQLKEEQEGGLPNLKQLKEIAIKKAKELADKFAELDGLKADLKILQLDIGEIIGVEVLKNAFYFNV